MPEQLALPFDREPSHDPEVVASGLGALARALASRIAAELGEGVRLVVTENRRRMLSARRTGGHVEVRVHRVFLGADVEVWDAIGAYLREGGGPASARISAFLTAHRPALVEARRNARTLRTRGRHHDLASILEGLVARYFEGHADVGITWGTRPSRHGARRTIQLGTYLPDERLIRIHPSLDEAWVPAFYVESVVFHELLHHALPAEERNGRRLHHTRAFRVLERAYEHHEAARSWERAHLHRLARPRPARRRGASTACTNPW